MALKKWQDFLLMVGIAIAILVVILGGVIWMTSRSSSKKPQQYDSRYAVGSLERAVEAVTIGAMGKTVNWAGSPSTLIGITKTEQAAGPDEGGYLVTVKYRANENLTKGMTKSGIIINAMYFTKKLYLDPECSQVKIYMLMPHLTLVDKYGNKKMEQVGKLSLRGVIASRVNWDNMHQGRFEQILRSDGELWLHPAIAR